VVAAVHYVVAFMHKRRSLERVAFLSLAAGFVLHTASLIMDWVEDGHYPLFGLRETVSFLAWTLVVAYLLTLTRYRTVALGGFTLPLVSVLTFTAMVARDSSTGATGELARSAGAPWIFPLHTTLLISAYAAFFVVFAASVMYLVQERELKHKNFGAFFHRLDGNSCSMLVAAADKHHILLLGTEKTHINIRRDIGSREMAHVFQTVGVGKG
jgi:ABC-type transport system involved in cytochrome c biogenesis permease subunit